MKERAKYLPLPESTTAIYMIPTSVNYLNLWSIVDIGSSRSVRCTIVFQEVESRVNSISDNSRNTHIFYVLTFVPYQLHTSNESAHGKKIIQIYYAVTLKHYRYICCIFFFFQMHTLLAQILSKNADGLPCSLRFRHPSTSIRSIPGIISAEQFYLCQILKNWGKLWIRT